MNGDLSGELGSEKSLKRVASWSLTALALSAFGCSPAGASLPSDTSETGGAATFNDGAGGSFTAPDGAGGAAPVGAGGSPVGNGSGGSAPVPTGDAGTQPFGGYDPSVTFDWPEATATTGSCKAGHYTGSFAGMYASGLTFVGVPIPVAGNLDLTLNESADGEFFTISGGKLSGVADGLFPFSADVSGTLDCKKAELVDGKLSNGVYDLGVQGITGGTFEGPFPATYDKLTAAFTGTWKVYEPKMSTPPPIYGGNGTWQVTWVGP
jgi:hypothetical protein